MCPSGSVSRENLQRLAEGSYPTGSPVQGLQDRTGHLSQSHALPGSAQPVAEGGVPLVGRLHWLPSPHGSPLRWPRLSQNCSTISGSPYSVTGGRPLTFCKFSSSTPPSPAASFRGVSPAHPPQAPARHLRLSD